MQDNKHVSSLLGLSGTSNLVAGESYDSDVLERLSAENSKLADVLMKTLLINMGFQTVIIGYSF